MQFPEYFPVGCPPCDAKTDSDKVLYRFCFKPDEITEMDFKSYYQLGIPFKGIKGFGLSMLSSKNEAKEYLKLPTTKKFKGLCVGTSGEDGVWLETPSDNIYSHITWWLYKDVTPWKRFQIVEEK